MQAWIGLTKEHNNCTDIACLWQGWMWADETPYTFKDWTASEPEENDFYACLSNTGWQGFNPRQSLALICEYGNRQNPTFV